MRKYCYNTAFFLNAGLFPAGFSMTFGKVDVLFVVELSSIHRRLAVSKSKKTAVTTSKTKKAAIEKKNAKPLEDHAPIKNQYKTVSINRRINQQQDRRRDAERRHKDIPVAVEHRICERRVKVNRRRQIDPTTCERDYTLAEIEFMNAIEEYKRTSGRMFPTCSEVLEVLQKLGYEKRADPVPSLAIPTSALEPTLVPDISPPLATF
jgi:hypothetical protein